MYEWQKVKTDEQKEADREYLEGLSEAIQALIIKPLILNCPKEGE